MVFPCVLRAPSATAPALPYLLRPCSRVVQSFDFAGKSNQRSSTA